MNPVHNVLEKVVKLIEQNLSAQELDELALLVDSGSYLEEAVCELNQKVNPEKYIDLENIDLKEGF